MLDRQNNNGRTGRFSATRSSYEAPHGPRHHAYQPSEADGRNLRTGNRSLSSGSRPRCSQERRGVEVLRSLPSSTCKPPRAFPVTCREIVYALNSESCTAAPTELIWNGSSTGVVKTRGGCGVCCQRLKTVAIRPAEVET